MKNKKSETLLKIINKYFLLPDENKGITADVVAVDMLGLMRQNLLPRHLRLITAVFDLLHCAVKNTHTDELKGSAVPLSMLPIFFQLEVGAMFGFFKVRLYSSIQEWIISRILSIDHIKLLFS